MDNLWKLKPIKIRSVMLVALSLSFVPVSYMWYGALSNFDCNESPASPVQADPFYKGCAQKATSHWAMFYGLNAMIYGVPMMALIFKLKK